MNLLLIILAVVIVTVAVVSLLAALKVGSDFDDERGYG